MRIAIPQADLAELLNLAQRGMMHGIREKVAAMAMLDPSIEPFVNELPALAPNFREKDLLALIQNQIAQ